MVSYTQFLTKDPLDNYEDAEKFKEFVPKIEKYRKALADAVKEEYKIELPKPIDELVKSQFNPLAYLYEKKLLSEKEFEITDSAATIIVKKIADSEWSSVEVFNAFAKRATIAHQFLGCAMDLFVDEGLKRAEYLDDYLKKNGKTVGPLHGLPVSLKEQINFKNRITHGGYVSLIDNIPSEHGVTPTLLEKLGAIFYVRTSQPQTLMHLDSNNNITGITKNPHNMSLSPGGSSSGEGAIIGYGGSPVGIGSDIGGSIRGPSAYSGCHGLRPTTRRFSTSGGISGGAGQESVPAVQGPMTRSIDDIDLIMNVYINEGKPWEHDAWSTPLTWRQLPKPSPKDITIGVLYDDGIVRPSPPIQRGLKHTVDKLKAAGAKVVEFKPIRTTEAFETVNKMYACDGNYMQRKLLSDSGEPLTKLTKWSLNYGDGAKEYTVKENRQLNIVRDSLRTEYTKFMVENKIDFILSPAYNNVAPKHEEVYNWSYTALFNILDFPTLTFQTGLSQDPKIDKWDDTPYKYRSALEELENTNYKPDEFVGAPIGLQLSGRRYFDEEVVAAGKTIVDILGVDLFKYK